MNQFNQLEQAVAQLPFEQLKRLQLLITSLVDQKSGVSLLNQQSALNRECPHCGSCKVKKHGMIASRQRFYCKSCTRTYVSTIHTPLYRIRKLPECHQFMRCMLDSLSVRISAARCNVNKNTAFKWRHKFLAQLMPQDEIKLTGIVEVDETLFRYSEKGSRRLKRAPHKRGRDGAGRGRTKGDWVPVVVARDREQHLLDYRLDNAEADDLVGLLGNKIAPDAVVCSDGFPSYKLMCQKLCLAHKKLNISKGIRQLEEVFHVQNVNAYHSRLHNWMDRFRGVATKYLPNYLAWHRFFEAHQNPTESNLLLAQTHSSQT